MDKKFLISLGVLASFLWCSLALSRAVPKEKGKENKETTPQVQVTENKIDYSKIEWMSREELKSKFLFNELRTSSHTPYLTTGVFKSRPDYPIVTSSPLWDTAGYTYYDLANHDRLPRLIALDIFGNVHIDWTKGFDSTSSGAGKREIAYASFWKADTVVQFDWPVSGEGEDKGARGGYTSLAVLPDGRAICAYHHANPLLGKPQGTYVSIEGSVTNGDWLPEIHAPDSTAGMQGTAIYPSCAGQKVTGGPADTNVVHVVAVEFGGIGNSVFTYTRGREIGAGSGDFVFSQARSPDSSDFISATVVASRKSNKVAIIYNHQKNFDDINEPRTDADLYYIESTTGGRDWVDGFQNGPPNNPSKRDTAVNVTKYSPGAPIRASGSVSGVYDEEDSLHIVWVAPLYNAGLFASECYIYHWSKEMGIDQVANGTFPVQDATLPTSEAKFNLRYPQIGVHDGTADLTRKNYLYVTWTQHGPTTTDLSVGNIINGEIYVNASTNGGNTWGEPKNITNSHTPGCDRNCDSDVYASLAERVNDTLHITYINDKRAGGLDQGGVEVLDPILYYKYPAYKPGAFNGISNSPPTFEDPVADIGGDLQIETTLIISNVGNQTLIIDSVKKSGASPWLKLQTTGFPDTILEGGIPKIVACTLNGTGLGTAAYTDTITVYNNSDNDSISKVPVHLVVTGCGYSRRSGLIDSTGDIRIKISNTTNFADQDVSNGYFMITLNKNLIFDGSGVMTTTTTDGDTVTLQDISGNHFVHPLSVLDTHFVNLPDSIIYAQTLRQMRPAKAGDWLKIGPDTSAMFYPDIKPAIPWPGPWFRYKIVDTWWIKNTAKPRYILWFRKLFKSAPPCWWPNLPSTPYIAGNIYSGSLLDWDIADDSGGTDDYWGNNDTLQMVWMQARGAAQSKYLIAQAAMADTSVHIGNPNGFWSAKVNRNSARYGGPPWSGEDIHHQMSNPGFFPKDTLVDPEALLAKDRHIVWASVAFDTTKDTVAYCQALVITELGYDSLKKNVEKARLDMKLPLKTLCTYKPGDVDGNNSWTLVDIVGLVGMVFKGAPKPTPLCRADCNGTGGNPTLTDIVYLVSKVFKGGANPVKIGECCKD